MVSKVAIVIETEYHARNYLTGLLDFTIDNDINYSLILPKDFASKTQLIFPKERTHFVEFGSRHKRLFLFIREINRLSNSKKSSSFMYSQLRSYPPLLSLIRKRLVKHVNQETVTLDTKKNALQTGIVKLTKTILQPVRSLIYFILRRLRLLIVQILSLSTQSKYVVEFLSGQIREVNLIGKLEEINPHIVLYVTSLYEYSSIPLARYCKQKKIDYVVIPDNWDNLSSKRTLWERPDYVGVWGDQGVHHLSKVHGIERDRALHVGSPRMTPLLRNRHSATSENHYKALLFVGTSIKFDECSVIEALLDKTQSSVDNIVLTYRPYPWRTHEIPINILNHKNFVMDNSIEKNIFEKCINDFNPHFDEYVNLLQTSDVVVGGLSTMLLEAAVIGKQVVGLIHNDNSGSIDSPHLGFKNFEHFRGLEKFPNLILCDNLDNLWDLITVSLRNGAINLNEEFLNARDWFYNEKNTLFIQNLNANLRRIMQLRRVML